MNGGIRARGRTFPQGFGGMLVAQDGIGAVRGAATPYLAGEEEGVCGTALPRYWLGRAGKGAPVE